jgi:hypothetical protein
MNATHTTHDRIDRPDHRGRIDCQDHRNRIDRPERRPIGSTPVVARSGDVHRPFPGGA